MTRNITTFCAGLVLAAAVAAGSALAQGILNDWKSVQAPPPPPLMRVMVDPKTTALLVLDVAKHTCNEQVRPRCVAMLPSVGKLMAKMRARGVPVVYALGVLPTPGVPSDIWPEAAMVGDEPWVRSGPDKYLNTDLEKILKDRGASTVIVIGTASHGAVLHTASESVFRGMNVIVPVDAVAAESTYAEQYTLWHLTNAPRMADKVKLTSVDMIE
ncbi:isochorismatase family protein [Bradyrhizobium sp. LA6.7]|uniref:isochorismatase family protein n=1 Tax=unclassified Bradyrhizobium TaxID=2631580 RepID=UPI0033984CDF